MVTELSPLRLAFRGLSDEDLDEGDDDGALDGASADDDDAGTAETLE